MSFLIGTVGLYDLRLIGIGQGISYEYLHRLVPFGVPGYALNMITAGTMFLSSAPDQYLYNPAFQTKLLLVAVAGINMLIYCRSLDAYIKQQSAADNMTISAKTVALISLSCWCGVIVFRRLIAYFRPSYH